MVYCIESHKKDFTMKKTIGAILIFFSLLILATLLSVVEGMLVLSVFISAVLIAAFTGKSGPAFAVWSFPIVFLTGHLISGEGLAAFLCAQAICAWIQGIFIFKKGTFSGMLICTTAAEAATLAVFTRLLCDSLSKEPADLLFGDSLKAFSEAAPLSGQMDAEMLSVLQNAVHMVGEMLQSMLPFFYLVTSLIFVYIVFASARFVLERQKCKIENMPKFCEFWLPRSISNIFLVLFVISMFINAPILMNVVSFMFFIHVICGVSTVDYFLKMRGLATAARVLLLVVILTISTAIGGLGTSILCCIGMNDWARRAGK